MCVSYSYLITLLTKKSAFLCFLKRRRRGDWPRPGKVTQRKFINIGVSRSVPYLVAYISLSPSLHFNFNFCFVSRLQARNKTHTTQHIAPNETHNFTQFRAFEGHSRALEALASPSYIYTAAAALRSTRGLCVPQMHEPI